MKESRRITGGWQNSQAPTNAHHWCNMCRDVKQESITKKFSDRKTRIALPEVAIRHALRELVPKQKTERPKKVLPYLKFRTTFPSEGHYLYEFYDWVCRHYTVHVSMFKKLPSGLIAVLDLGELCVWLPKANCCLHTDGKWPDRPRCGKRFKVYGWPSIGDAHPVRSTDLCCADNQNAEVAGVYCKCGICIGYSVMASVMNRSCLSKPWPHITISCLSLHHNNNHQ